MKIYSIFLLLIFYSCSIKEENANKKVSDINEKQTNIKSAENDSLLNEKAFIAKVKMQVYYSSSYCGGAPPNEEILAELHKKRWYQNSAMRIFQLSDAYTEFKCKTNHEGYLEIELPIGYSYVVLLDKNPDEQMSHLFNPNCSIITEKKWAEFTLNESSLSKENSISLKVVIDFPCDPCDPTIKMRS